MTKRNSLAGVLALVMLAACSKPAPAPSVEDTNKDVAPAAAPQPETPQPSMGPADYPTKLLPMIDTSPQCQPFRAELEEAARVQSSDPLPVDMNKVNEIVARAHAAGCGRKP
jgi:PBP1b-binding outer membrane lipoprotein LpoB